MRCAHCAGFGALLAVACGAALCAAPPRVERVTAADIAAQPGHKMIYRDDGLYRPPGRVLEYRIFGDESSKDAVVFIHGWSQSCKLGQLWAPEANRLSLKLISISIPGFGLSEGPPPGVLRNLSAFALDVAAVADAEGADMFHLMAYSGGGLHAVMAAHGNSARVKNMLLQSPAAPADADVEGTEVGIDLAWTTETASMVWSWPLTYVAWLLVHMMGANARMNVAPDVRRGMARHDETGLLAPSGQPLSRWVYADQKYATAHSWRGMSLEQAHTRRLAFNLSDVRVWGNIGVSFTADDTSNRPSVAKWFCSGMPGCTLLEHAPKGYGHTFVYVPTTRRRALEFIKTGKCRGDRTKALPADSSHLSALIMADI